MADIVIMLGMLSAFLDEVQRDWPWQRKEQSTSLQETRFLPKSVFGLLNTSI